MRRVGSTSKVEARAAAQSARSTTAAANQEADVLSDKVSELAGRIMGLADSLTPKQRRLGRFMLENELYVAVASAQQVGQASEVDPATVVRFSRLLGYSGFAELREAIRLSTPAFLTASEKVERSPKVMGSDTAMVDAVYSQDVDNIQTTATLNSAADISMGLKLLREARELFVVGTALSAPVASLFAYNLMLVGARARAVVGPFAQSAAEIASMSEEDVVVAIGLWRYLEDTVTLLSAAQAIGARSIALTDTRLSPLAKAADVTLLCSTQTPEMSQSMTAVVSVCTGLASGLALTDPSRALQRLERIDELYKTFGLIVE